MISIPERAREKRRPFYRCGSKIFLMSTNTKNKKKGVNKIKYLAVGSLVGWRGFDILIEAFFIGS